MSRDSFRRVALLACALFCACSTPGQLTAIASSAKSKLVTIDPDAATAVKVMVTADGTVTLAGQARDQQERAAYDSAAASVPRVNRVVDRLRINPALRGNRETLADGALTAKVAANIAAQAGVNVANVKPTVRDGVVTLTGTASSASVKTTILDTARKTNGVKTVIDRIEVKP